MNARMDEQAYFVQGTSLVALTGAGGDAAYVSLKNYRKATIIVDILNATTVTGTAITLKQATTVAGGSEKALAFTRMLSNIDVGAAQTMVEAAVTSNTFTSDTTNSKRLRYIIEVDSEQLDVANGFDCFRVDGASGVNSIGLVSYILWGAKYNGASPMAD